jgi:hypothetical protein
VGAASAIERMMELDKRHASGSLSDADYETELSALREEMKKY